MRAMEKAYFSHSLWIIDLKLEADKLPDETSESLMGNICIYEPKRKEEAQICMC